MDQGDTTRIRSAAEAGWHVSRYNIQAPIPDSNNVAIYNTYRRSCASYTPIDLHIMSSLDEVPKDNALIERLARRGAIANFDEREAHETQRRLMSASPVR